MATNIRNTECFVTYYIFLTPPFYRTFYAILPMFCISLRLKQVLLYFFEIRKKFF